MIILTTLLTLPLSALFYFTVGYFFNNKNRKQSLVAETRQKHYDIIIDAIATIVVDGSVEPDEDKRKSIILREQAKIQKSIVILKHFGTKKIRRFLDSAYLSSFTDSQIWLSTGNQFELLYLIKKDFGTLSLCDKINHCLKKS